MRARPDSVAYRLSTFVRRNRALVAALSVAVLALVTGTGVSLWQAARARDEARRSTLVADFLRQVLGAGDLGGQLLDVPRLGPATSIAEMLDSAAAWAPRALASDAEVRATVQHVLANALATQERYDAAVAEYDSAIATSRTSDNETVRRIGASAMALQGAVLLVLGKVARADSVTLRAVATFDSLPGRGTTDEAQVLLALSSFTGATSPREADSLGREAVAIFSRAAGPRSVAVA